MNSKIKFILKAALILILLCIFVWSVCGLHSYANEYNELNKSYKEAQDLVQIGAETEIATGIGSSNIDQIVTTEPSEIEEEDVSTEPIDKYEDLKITIDIDWESLNLQSNDVVGWLYIPGTNVNYPLVHRDNDYYLNHDYKGNWNSGGSIFLEKQVTMDSKNIVIYGHHMRSDIMFHRLTYYADQEYADNHRYIYIATEDETRMYQVFSVVYTKNTSDTYTLEFGGDGEMTFNEYIDNAINNSVVETNVREITEDDRIVSLSTCTGRIKTERLVVHALLLATY